MRNLLALATLSLAFVACEKGEEGELMIDFKEGTAYVHSDTTLAGGTAVMIGIDAETEKAKDPIIRFNISESVNGGTNATIYTEDMETTQYTYDHMFTLDTTSGATHKYTYTITNRDGINAQKSLTITVQ